MASPSPWHRHDAAVVCLPTSRRRQVTRNETLNALPASVGLNRQTSCRVLPIHGLLTSCDSLLPCFCPPAVACLRGIRGYQVLHETGRSTYLVRSGQRKGKAERRQLQRAYTPNPRFCNNLRTVFAEQQPQKKNTSQLRLATALMQN